MHSTNSYFQFLSNFFLGITCQVEVKDLLVAVIRT